MIIGSKIIHLDSVDSTNNYAASLISSGKVGHGAVILADEQTQGRGQRGAVWHSESGSNLLASIVLKPDNLTADKQFLLTQVASLSVSDLLRKFGISSMIKWPNDIYVGNKKICGMLIENQLSGNRISNAVIGIGLNVNQKVFPLFNATSVYAETNQFYAINEILMSLISSFNQVLELYQNYGQSAIEELYKERLLGCNELRVFRDLSGEFEGMIKGFESDGRLQILVKEVIRTYDLKELQFIFQNEF